MDDGKCEAKELDPAPDSTEEKAKTFLTIRLIRSFEHRNWKPLVISGVSLSWTTEELITKIKDELMTSQMRQVFKNYTDYNTLKIECHPQKFKSNDPLINRSSDPSLILKNGVTLKAQGIVNGTEISYFCDQDYKKYDAVTERK